MIKVLTSVFFILGAGFVLAQVVNFYLSINSGSGKTKQDIAELKSKIATYLASLVPMTNNELELLSVNKIGSQSRKGLTTIKSGAFTSIYQEPLVAYAYKEYSYPADKSLLLVSTEEDDFIYMTSGAKTQVFVNDTELGMISADGSLHEVHSNKLLAKIQADRVLSSHPVEIGGKEMGEIVNVKLNQSPNPRAYQFLEPMDEKEAQIFKALTFLSLVEESI